MTRIGGSDAGSVGQGDRGLSRDDSLQSDRHAQAQREARTADIGGKRDTARKPVKSPEADERALSFQQRMKAAQAGQDGETLRPNEPREDSVLAVAAWKSDGPYSGPSEPGRLGDAKPATMTAPAVTALVERIEQAVRAEMFAAAGRPSIVIVDLGGAIEGLKSLTVAMTETALDVTLMRGEGVAGAELIAAAQVLADQLQQRFGRRLVRVLDATGEAAAESEERGGMQAISRILGHQVT